MQIVEAKDERARESQLFDEFGEFAKHAVASDAQVPFGGVAPKPERWPAMAFERATLAPGDRATRPPRRHPARGTAARVIPEPRCKAPPRRDSRCIGRVRYVHSKCGELPG